MTYASEAIDLILRSQWGVMLLYCMMIASTILLSMGMLSKLKYHSLSQQEPNIIFMIMAAYPCISEWDLKTL